MNNSFNENMAQICGLELSTLAGSFKYSVFGQHACVIEGHTGIATYTETQVSFNVRKKLLTVTGNNLQICRLNKNFAVVTGDICKVEVVDK
ncbi:MAG: YabP/YqfC family sporulation protein [Clostridia bacterium]|nr:YabP/YqfC family sporulation protein [Clostridia bacterium]